MQDFFYILFPAVGYLLGSFPTGVVLSRRKYGIDVREMGSGNIGATNITRNFGWYAGMLTFLIDFFKGYFPLVFLQKVFPDDPWLVAVMGVSLVIGHCFSLYLKFGGGKGVATSLGCFLAVSPWGAIVGGAVYLLCLVLTRISAVGSLAGIATAILYVSVAKEPDPTRALVYAISLVVFIRHTSNIKRLWAGFRTRRSS